MEQVRQAIKALSHTLFNVDIDPELTRPDEQFGDYATNVALQLAAQLKQKPREIAEKLTAELKNQLADQVSEVNIAGPGFINLRLKDQTLAQAALKTDLQKPLNKKVVVIEYSDPNPFKVLHAGHLYTTVVGDVIAKMLETAGATVHRLNYGGDVGLHVGKTMWAILQHIGGEYPEELAKVKPAERLEWLSARYIEGNQAYEDDPAARQAIIELNKRVYQLHEAKDKTTKFAQIYWTGRQWSYQGFDALYAQLQISPFEKYIPESEVTPLGLEIVQEGLKKGVFEKSDGAVVFKGEEHGLHTRVFINANGLPTYEAKDLGLAAKKWQDYKFDLNVIVTANDIAEYMKVVLKALSHFYPEVVSRSQHLTHGVIKLPGGVKMSSRKGNILRATDILEAAREANLKAVKNDNHTTVLAAVKYAFLRQRIGGDIVYDPAESVAVQGNSGPYLQYAHARARSILAKASKVEPVSIKQLEPTERSLARKLSEYPEVFTAAVNELMPHHICTYLYELAQVFNRFYEKSHVIGDERQAIRLQLVEAYAKVLKSGLDLLNISAPEQM
ncbi:MAG: argS [Candidatus Saccharibacteria bacterium]|nr:argS [Candidatus Saccharibacteria bacterium]